MNASLVYEDKMYFFESVQFEENYTSTRDLDVAKMLGACSMCFLDLGDVLLGCMINEPLHEKTNNLQMRKQRRR